MRATAMAIALLLSGTAIAQTTNDMTSTKPTGTSSTNSQSSSMGTPADATPPTDTSDADMNNDVNTTGDTGTSTTTSTTSSGTISTDAGPTGTMTSGTATMGTGMQTGMGPASSQMVQPGNSDMERDARGIAVKSDPAMVPTGWNGVSGTGMGGPLVDASTGQSGAETSYPACSATVTDNCVQTYERGRAR